MGSVDTPFDLTTQVHGEGQFLAGYVAVLKVLNGAGEIESQFIAHEMNNYEAVGVLSAVLDRLRASNAAYDSFDDIEE